MSECYLCYTELEDGALVGDAHPACRKELYDRANKNVCTRCNKEFDPDDHNNPCRKCGPNGLYKGYTGSQ